MWQELTASVLVAAAVLYALRSVLAQFRPADPHTPAACTKCADCRVPAPRLVRPLGITLKRQAQ